MLTTGIQNLPEPLDGAQDIRIIDQATGSLRSRP